MQMPTRNEAFTRLELIFVIAALVVLIMLLPLRRYPSPDMMNCVNNLKQIGTGFRLWANDNDGKMPMQLSTKAGGTMEYTNAGQAYHHFFAASDMITDPRILVCPEDRKRVAAADFSTSPVFFNNSNVSYFINLKAGESFPNTILAGDRHLNVPPGNRDLFAILPGTRIGWTKELHAKWGAKGYVLMSDGSAQQFSTSQLQAWLTRNTNEHLFHFPNIR